MIIVMTTILYRKSMQKLNLFIENIKKKKKYNLYYKYIFYILGTAMTEYGETSNVVIVLVDKVVMSSINSMVATNPI